MLFCRLSVLNGVLSFVSSDVGMVIVFVDSIVLCYVVLSVIVLGIVFVCCMCICMCLVSSG